MIKRIVAIVLIYITCSTAWVILGSLNYFRTENTQDKLRGKVASLWGSQQYQQQPEIKLSYLDYVEETVTRKDAGTQREYTEVIKKETTSWKKLKLNSSNIKVNLDLDFRQKGLKWYSTYTVDFSGLYSVTIPKNWAKNEYVEANYYFPSSDAVYDDFTFTILNQEDTQIKEDLEASGYDNNVKKLSFPAVPGNTYNIKISYSSRGMDRWVYSFQRDVQEISNFNLEIQTNFNKIDFPENSISPTEKEKTDSGWKLNWKFDNLVSGMNIGMELPRKIDPGPLAARISFFAPVSLLFFFVIMFFITILFGIKLHPIHYMFLAASFFAFHLLFSYTVDHINIHLAFGLSTAVSIFLVQAYLFIVTGPKFALLAAGVSQLIYLVLFTFSFFFDGFTGLTVTIGSIVTLFILMQLTARINWEEKFSKESTK